MGDGDESLEDGEHLVRLRVDQSSSLSFILSFFLLLSSFLLQALAMAESLAICFLLKALALV